MVVPFILEFSTNSIHRYMRSPVSTTSTAVEASASMEATSTTVETTSKARLPAGGKASDIYTVIKTTGRAGMRSCRSGSRRSSVKARVPGAARVKRVAVVEVSPVEGVAIHDCSTVGDIG